MTQAVRLILGGVEFVGFEAPESLPFGGELMVKIHRLQGGARAIQVMGLDLAPIEWRGMFRGPAAVDRARAVEALWKASQPVTLSWGEFAYTVLITRFSGIFASPREVPYSLSVEVISDDASTGPSAAEISPTQMITGDAASATAASFPSSLSGLTAGVQSAVSSVGDFVQASKDQLAGVLRPVLAAREAVGAVFDQAEASLGSVSSVGGIAPGMYARDLASGLLAQASAALDGAQAFEADAYLGRLATNLGALASNGEVSTVAGGNLFAVARKVYGDAAEWATIANANGLTDPDIQGAVDLVIPPNARATGGVVDA